MVGMIVLSFVGGYVFFMLFFYAVARLMFVSPEQQEEKELIRRRVLLMKAKRPKKMERIRLEELEVDIIFKDVSSVDLPVMPSPAVSRAR